MVLFTLVAHYLMIQSFCLCGHWISGWIAPFSSRLVRVGMENGVHVCTTSRRLVRPFCSRISIWIRRMLHRLSTSQ